MKTSAKLKLVGMLMCAGGVVGFGIESGLKQISTAALVLGFLIFVIGRVQD